MDTFWELLKESVIVQGVLTLMVVGVWLYLVIMQLPEPPMVDTVVGLVIGFYFGSKSVMTAQKLFTNNSG